MGTRNQWHSLHMGYLWSISLQPKQSLKFRNSTTTSNTLAYMCFLNFAQLPAHPLPQGGLAVHVGRQTLGSNVRQANSYAMVCVCAIACKGCGVLASLRGSTCKPDACLRAFWSWRDDVRVAPSDLHPSCAWPSAGRGRAWSSACCEPSRRGPPLALSPSARPTAAHLRQMLEDLPHPQALRRHRRNCCLCSLVCGGLLWAREAATVALHAQPVAGGGGV